MKKKCTTIFRTLIIGTFLVSQINCSSNEEIDPNNNQTPQGNYQWFGQQCVDINTGFAVDPSNCGEPYTLIGNKCIHIPSGQEVDISLCGNQTQYQWVNEVCVDSNGTEVDSSNCVGDEQFEWVDGVCTDNNSGLPVDEALCPENGNNNGFKSIFLSSNPSTTCSLQENQSHCTLYISWTSNNIPVAQIWVWEEENDRYQYFGCGKESTQIAPWIDENGIYFLAFEAPNCDSLGEDFVRNNVEYDYLFVQGVRD